ncbi:MAG TPA: hypothetical protein VLA34_00695, partial [Candidatus Krumholzibacterium sp.]|nr:hypothetical protein [Candidatus Krumholzibacterium sp.]
TPDEDLIVYFVDTTGVFEPCIIDLESEPDISSRHALMVTDSRGIFETAGINVNRNTVFQWNATMNLLGFVASGNLCYFDPYAETLTVIPGEGQHPSEMAWSPDGTQCAVAVDIGVVLVSATGVVNTTPVYEKEKSTDGIVGLTWSPDTVDPKLAFRMIRKGKNVEDSFSALVMVYLNTGISAYASRSVNWSSAYEPAIDYTYMRLLFAASGGLYAPIPTPSWSGEPSRTVECAIFRSYE